MTSESAATSSLSDVPRLTHFPVTLFASVMGLSGLTLAIRHAETLLGWGHGASSICLIVTVVDFVVLAGFYALKAVRHPGAVRAEWAHPVRLAFFPSISISLLLIAAALSPHASGLAEGLWVFGAFLQVGLTLAVISGWIGHRPFQPMHISPAWFIPAVGNIVAPIAGVGFGYAEASWLFFSTGLIFWMILLTLVMNRLIFHDPLPARLLPTLVILIAPPAVGFLAWLQLNGGVVDALARILFYGAATFTGLVVTQIRSLLRLPFALSWWALSFPIAALTMSLLQYGLLNAYSGYTTTGLCLLAVLIMIVLYLVVRTLKAIQAGQICIPE